MVLGKLDSYMLKNKIRTFSHIIYKNKLKRIKDPNIKLENMKLSEENIDSTLFDIRLSKIYFFGSVSSGNGNKSKNRPMGPN